MPHAKAEPSVRSPVQGQASLNYCCLQCIGCSGSSPGTTWPRRLERLWNGKQSLLPGPEGLFAGSSVTFLQIELPQAQREVISSCCRYSCRGSPAASWASPHCPHTEDVNLLIPMAALLEGTAHRPTEVRVNRNPAQCSLLLDACSRWLLTSQFPCGLCACTLTPPHFWA